jgi:flagellar biosynthesis/type III secretory pathway chaperone
MTNTYHEIMASRLQAIIALTEALRESRAALLSRNANRVQQLTGQQEILCGELDFLDAELGEICNGLDRSLLGENTAALLEKTKLAEAEMVSTYKINAALLRRSRRALNVMINVAQSEANAYCSPASYRALQLAEE